ncbi:hypothetical protein ScPMuIL_011451 [Solemya velum]
MGQGAVKEKKANRKISFNEGEVSPKRASMPLFRKQSAKARRRQEHQQYLAKESPEPCIDLSNCEIQEIPSGVFSLCRVLQKETLLLYDNWLSSLHGGGKLTDLKILRVLDLHNNEIRSLPDDIEVLTSLQVLNVEKNKLSTLPDSICKLVCLQTLNLKGNRLKGLPESLCSLSCLRMLDISMNEISLLPKTLCQVRTLETLCLDCDIMHYPPSATCHQGTEAIMKYLCSESNLEYLPPSNFLLNILDPKKMMPHNYSDIHLSKPFREQESLMKTLEEYSNMMERRRKERVKLERQLQAHQQEQAELACLAAEQKQNLISVVAEDQDRLEKELDELTRKKENERLKLLSCLQEVERDAEELINHMLVMNEKAKKSEALVEAMEKERMSREDWFVVRWEEMQNLRQKEVLESMRKSLEETEYIEGIRQTYSTNKDQTMQQALLDEEMLSQGHVESTLYNRDITQMATLEQLRKQEQLQKEAFEALQLQKDAKHNRISNQIALVEEELAELTLVEIEKRSLRMEEELNRLAEKRIALIDLLTQLLSQQENRQAELRKRLQEMEQQRMDGQTDYWMVQYQRLMDRKPQSLIDQEKQIEIAVLKILEKANANEYIPLFARHRITIETLIWMSEDDLQQMGVMEMGTRKMILQYADEEHIEFKKEAMAPPPDVCGAAALSIPTAPPESSPSRQHSFVARGINSECSICLDSQSEVIFLYCGHVCCCISCSLQLKHCPLCRADIVQKIKLLTLVSTMTTTS